MPPARAIATAICDSVTVSILALTIGMAMQIRGVRQVAVLTSVREYTWERLGTNSTSSNVKPGFGRIRNTIASSN
jgi:hypothetical protein